MFLTEVRRHNDKNLYKWAISILTDLKNKGNFFSAHYLGYGQFTLEQNKTLLLDTNTTIVFCFDYMLEDTRKRILNEIEEKKGARLIWIGAEKDPFDHPRITNIFWPGDMLLQNKEYQKFDNIEKEPSNKTHWISTSLGIRPHRIYMASLLKGLGLDKYGDLRIKTVSSNNQKSPLVSAELAKGNGFAPDKIPTLSLYVKDKWKLSNEIKNISPQAEEGYQKLIQQSWWGSSIFLYSQYMALGFDQNNNALNFDKNLRTLYKGTCLEVVNETSHRYDPVFVTEKFINAVVGMNLIIMNGPAGTVKLLENLGWNSCRHIINHDYDDIDNPVVRCEQAVRLNIKLFTDSDHCISLWRDNFNILNENSLWARNHLYDQVLKNCEDQIKNHISH
jgi:hypothetical protein